MSEHHYRQEEPEQKHGFRFEPTLTLGHIIMLVSMLGTVLALWRNFETRVVILETHEADRQKMLEKISDSQSTITSTQARLQARMDMWDEFFQNSGYRLETPKTKGN